MMFRWLNIVRGKVAFSIVITAIAVCNPGESWAQLDQVYEPVVVRPRLHDGVAQTNDAWRAQLEQFIENNRTSTLNTEKFKAIVDEVFRAAKLSFNSCGNVNSSPHEMRFERAGMPTMRLPLGRLEYQLTNDEMAATEMSSWSGIPGIASVSGGVRTSRIRACIHHWELTGLHAEIDNGDLIIRFGMGSRQVSSVPTAMPTTYPLTKTLRKYQVKAADCPDFVPEFMCDVMGAGEWDDYALVNWSHPVSDLTIRDLHNVAGYFKVVLSTKIDNEELSYDIREVTWNFGGKPFTGSHDTVEYPDELDLQLFDNVPNIKNIIENYNDIQIQTSLRNFVDSVFQSDAIRQKISEELTDEVREGIPSTMTMKYLVATRKGLKVSFTNP